MGRLPAAHRLDLGLLLVVACHSGQGLDWGDFEISSAARDAPESEGAPVASEVEATAREPGSVPGGARELADPLPDVPGSAAPDETGAQGQTDGQGPPDAVEQTVRAPSVDAGADDAGARDPTDGDDGGNSVGSGRDDAGPTPSSTQVCPAPGGGPQEVRLLPDGKSKDCWVGESWELGRTRAGGTFSKADGITFVSAYLFGGNGSAKTQVYDADGHPLKGCVVVDDTADRKRREIAFEGAACEGAAYALVTAHASPDGDL